MKISFKKNFTRNLLNVPGWTTNRKIIVIESDDWGTIRMSSKQAYRNYLKKNLPVNECPYNKNDGLESNVDLEQLFEVLSAVKDRNNNPAIITANNIVANPDFDQIRASNFQQYFYEPFTETLKHYPEHDQVQELYKEGIKKKIFMPQFHGREHVNVDRWLKALQDGDKMSHLAFDHSMFSVHSDRHCGGKFELMDALDSDSLEGFKKKEEIVIDGLKIFESIWGFKSKSFIAPCYIWDLSIEPVLANNGVQFIQGMANQMIPIPIPVFEYKRKYHYQGQKNKHGQRYLIRNAFFEPSASPDFDWINDCLNRIAIAFKWHKPAIIGTHRVNFIGSIRQENRTSNLILFKELLKKIIQRWPDAEFMSSDQLGGLMETKSNDKFNF